jgi:hypothetical protein
VLLGLTTRGYHRHDHAAVPDIVPALLATLVSRPDPDAFPIPDLDVLGIDQAHIDHAWRQLRRELPQVELPEAAELLLERYAWSRFDEGGPTSPVEPSPSRSPTPSSGVAGDLDVSSTATSDPSHADSDRDAGTAEAADA